MLRSKFGPSLDLEPQRHSDEQRSGWGFCLKNLEEVKNFFNVFGGQDYRPGLDGAGSGKLNIFCCLLTFLFFFSINILIKEEVIGLFKSRVSV